MIKVTDPLFERLSAGRFIVLALVASWAVGIGIVSSLHKRDVSSFSDLLFLVFDNLVGGGMVIFAFYPMSLPLLALFFVFFAIPLLVLFRKLDLSGYLRGLVLALVGCLSALIILNSVGAAIGFACGCFVMGVFALTKKP